MITLYIKRKFTKGEIVDCIEGAFDTEEYLSRRQLMQSVTARHLRRYGMEYIEAMELYGERSRAMEDHMSRVIEAIADEIRMKHFP